MSFKHNLNRLLLDCVTGFMGHSTARMESIVGEPQYQLERIDHVGNPTAVWFPESRLTDKGPSVESSVEMSLIEHREVEEAKAATNEAETSQHRPLPAP